MSEKSSVFLLTYKDVEEGKKTDELIFWCVCFIRLFQELPGSPVVKLRREHGSNPWPGTKIPYAMHQKNKTKQTKN